jgi:hypothetical protein
MTLGTQTQADGQPRPYEQFTDGQLANARKRINITNIFTAFLVLMLGVVSTLLLEIILDHAFGLPLLARRIVLLVGSSVAVGYAAWKIALPLITGVVVEHHLVKVVYTFCGMIVAFCLYTNLTTKSTLDSAKRAFLVDVARPTSTKLSSIQPGTPRPWPASTSHSRSMSMESVPRR